MREEQKTERKHSNCQSIYVEAHEFSFHFSIYVRKCKQMVNFLKKKSKGLMDFRGVSFERRTRFK
jgi:hypothetical protein